MKLIVKKKLLLYILLFFPILKMNYFSHFSFANTLYQFGLLFSCCFCLIKYIKSKRLPSVYVLLFILLECYLYFITYLNHGNVQEVMRIARSVICMACIVDLYQHDIKTLLNALYLYFMFFSVINLFLMVCFPNGIYSTYIPAYGEYTVEWLFGVGNVSISWHYPAVIVAWIYSTLMNDKKYGWYMSIIALISHFIDGSATTIVGILIILVFQNFHLIRKFVTPKVGISIIMIAFFMIVIQQEFDFLEPFIVGFLHKDMTFTGRLVIWWNAFESFLENPIMGHGIMFGKDVINILGKMPNINYLWEGATHCHDNYLQILFTGGLVSGSIYFLIYKDIFKQILKYWKNPMTKVIFSCLFSFMVIQISESFDNTIIVYLILILALNTKSLISAYELQSGEKR